MASREYPLEPVGQDFDPTMLTGVGEGEFQVTAELLEILGLEASVSGH